MTAHPSRFRPRLLWVLALSAALTTALASTPSTDEKNPAIIPVYIDDTDHKTAHKTTEEPGGAVCGCRPGFGVWKAARGWSTLASCNWLACAC